MSNTNSLRWVGGVAIVVFAGRIHPTLSVHSAPWPWDFREVVRWRCSGGSSSRLGSEDDKRGGAAMTVEDRSLAGLAKANSEKARQNIVRVREVTGHRVHLFYTWPKLTTNHRPARKCQNCLLLPLKLIKLRLLRTQPKGIVQRILRGVNTLLNNPCW